jgi:hypothetical protein
LGNFVEFLEQIVSRGGRTRATSAGAENIRTLYPDRLDEVITARVWRVVINPSARSPVLVNELIEQVTAHAENTALVDETYYYAYSIYPPVWQQLQALGEAGQLSALPSQTTNQIVYLHGQEALRREGILIFVWISLPRIGGANSYYLLENEIRIQILTRELDFLVNAESFERLLGVSWQNYLDEYGDRPALLHIQVVFPARRIHYRTLRHLMSERVGETVSQEAAYFGGLYLLNRTLLAILPQAAREPVNEQSDDLTRALPEESRFDYWDPDWTGAYIYAAFELDETERAQALYRAPARRLVEPLIAYLRQDSDELMWPYHLETFLRHHFSTQENSSGPPGNTFEYLLAELESHENGRWFNRLFDMVEGVNHWDLHHRLIQLALTTRYASHERVRRTITLINNRRRGGQRHIYRPGQQEIWIDGSRNKAVGGASRPDLPHVVADVEDFYMGKQTDQRLRAERRPVFLAAVDRIKVQMIGEILSGADPTTYTEESFASRVLTRAAEEIHLSEDDMEEITILTSLEIVRIERRTEEAIERHYLTVQSVQKIEEDNERWRRVPNTETVLSDSEFEELLTFWRIARVGEATTLISQIVVGGAMLVIAWEVGAIGLLVRVAGGAARVIPAIVISEVLYLIRSRDVTPAGLLEAAVQGYMFALGLRLVSGLGLRVAGAFGTQSLTRLFVGHIIGRMVEGGVGGAIGMTLGQFGTDLLRILLGQQDRLSSAETYIMSAAEGFIMGMAVELVLGAAAPLFAPEIRSLGEAVTAIRRAGFSPRAWQELSAGAIERMNIGMRSLLREGQLASGITAAFRSRLAQIGVEYRLVSLQQAARVGRLELSSAAEAALRRFTAASINQMSLENSLALINRLGRQPGQLNRFLETLAGLDDQALASLFARSQIEALAGSPNLLSLVRSRGTGAINLLEGSFGGAVTEMEGFLARLVRQNPERQNLVLELLGRSGRVVPPETLLQAVERLGGLSESAYSSLNRLAGTRFGGRELAAVLRDVPRQQLNQLLELVGRLSPEMVERLAASSVLRPLASAPRCLRFASEPENLEAILEYVGRSGQPAEAIASLERYLSQNSRLSAPEIRAAIGRMSPGALEIDLMIAEELEALGSLEAAGGQPLQLTAPARPRVYRLQDVDLSDLTPELRAQYTARYPAYVEAIREAIRTGRRRRAVPPLNDYIRMRHGFRTRQLVRDRPLRDLGARGAVEQEAGHIFQRVINNRLPPGSANWRELPTPEGNVIPDHLPPGRQRVYLDAQGNRSLTPTNRSFSAEYLADSKYRDFIPNDPQTRGFVHLAQFTDDGVLAFYVRWQTGFPPTSSLSGGMHNLGYVLPDTFIESIVARGIRDLASRSGVRIRLISDPIWR